MKTLLSGKDLYGRVASILDIGRYVVPNITEDDELLKCVLMSEFYCDILLYEHCIAIDTIRQSKKMNQGF